MKEMDLINYFSKIFKFKDKSLILGPKDDCAVLDVGAKEYLLLTIDEMVEGTHFLMDFSKPDLIAKKLTRMSVSDIYSMGKARAKTCLIGAGINKNISVLWIKKFSKALKKEAKKFSMTIAGGNISKSKENHFSMSVIGQVNKNKIIRREGAKIGDLVFAIGKNGLAKAGLEILLSKKEKLNKIEKKLVKSFWEPKIYFKEANIIADYATSMLDNSDGLNKSLEILSKGNKVFIEVNLNKNFISNDLYKYCNINKKDWRYYSIYSGEDYGLIFTIRKDSIESLKKKIPYIYQIGEIKKGKGIKYLNYEGKIENFEHFKK